MITKWYKDSAGEIWRGPLCIGDKQFFATACLVKQQEELDPSWVEIERQFAMSLDAVNAFVHPHIMSINDTLSERALWVATVAHEGQKRWNGDAYIGHPIQVANLLADTDDDKMVVAYLHDVVEDTDVTLDQLRSFGFTEVQVEAVDSVTRKEGEDWESYLDFVLRAKANPIGRKVKIADIRSNLMRTKEHLAEKYRLALWILEENDEAIRLRTELNVALLPGACCRGIKDNLIEAMRLLEIGKNLLNDAVSVNSTNRVTDLQWHVEYEALRDKQ